MSNRTLKCAHLITRSEIRERVIEQLGMTKNKDAIGIDDVSMTSISSADFTDITGIQLKSQPVKEKTMTVSTMRNIKSDQNDGPNPINCSFYFQSNMKLSILSDAKNYGPITDIIIRPGEIIFFGQASSSGMMMIHKIDDPTNTAIILKEGLPFLRLTVMSSLLAEAAESLEGPSNYTIYLPDRSDKLFFRYSSKTGGENITKSIQTTISTDPTEPNYVSIFRSRNNSGTGGFTISFSTLQTTLHNNFEKIGSPGMHIIINGQSASYCVEGNIGGKVTYGSNIEIPQDNVKIIDPAHVHSNATITIPNNLTKHILVPKKYIGRQIYCYVDTNPTRITNTIAFCFSPNGVSNCESIHCVLLHIPIADK